MNTNFDPRAVHHQQHRAPQFIREPQRFPQQPPTGGRPVFHPQGFPGQQFRGPVPPPPAAPLPRKRPIAGKIIAGLVAAGLVVGGAGAWYTLSGYSSPAVQATSFAGADPTTSPFGTDAPQVATVAADGPQSGDTTGLYAATTPPSCDGAAFLDELRADPTKLAAWGGVFGLDAADVPAFVDSLSPVVLRAATSVTDHPFREGAFVEEAAVLAPGTAVLVNSYGEPTVKCFNGNPLSAGPQADAAVTVTPTTQVVTNFRFTSVDNSRVVVIPGKPDTKPVPGPNKPPTTGGGTGTGGTGGGGTGGGGTTAPSKPDPVLQEKADGSKKIADLARQTAAESASRAAGAREQATELRTASDRLSQASTDAKNRANQAGNAVSAAQNEFDAALRNPLDIVRLGRAQAALDAAHKAARQATTEALEAIEAAKTADGEADTAESQLKNAESKARNDENVAKTAEENAKKAQEAADASAKETTTKPATDPEALVDPEGQAIDTEPQVPAVPAEAGTGNGTGTGTTDTGTGTGTTAATCPAGTTAIADPTAPCTAATTGTDGVTTGSTTPDDGSTTTGETTGTGSESSGSAGSSESGSSSEGSATSSEATEN